MSFPGFALGAGLAEEHKAQNAQKQDEERQAQLVNIANAGLPPEATQEAIRTLYAKDPSALKQHIQNLIGRVQGKQSQPTPMVDPAQSSQVGGDQQIGGGSLPAPNSQFMATPNAAGLLEPGNLDISNRPVVQNADGSHSTEYSTSFEENGREVLVPTVVNGKFLTPDGKKPPEGS